MDKTESRLKIIGHVGAVIGGFSTMAVGAWRTFKEHDKIHDSDKKDEIETEEESEKEK